MSEEGTDVVLGAGLVECFTFVARFAPSLLQRIILPGGRVRVLDSPPKKLPHIENEPEPERDSSQHDNEGESRSESRSEEKDETHYQN